MGSIAIRMYLHTYLIISLTNIRITDTACLHKFKATNHTQTHVDACTYICGILGVNAKNKRRYYWCGDT